MYAAIPPFHRQDERALGNLQPCDERPRVPDFIDVDFRRPGGRAKGLRIVVEVIPALRIIQATGHVDAVR